jgi:hypothetical protein
MNQEVPIMDRERMPVPAASNNPEPLCREQRRKLLKRQYRSAPWIKVLEALLGVLVLGDFANLFMAVESTIRGGYLVITAVSVSLTLLCVALPFLDGKLWRQRAGGSPESTYALVAVLTIAWIALITAITLLRLKTEGVVVPSVGDMTTGGGSAIASLGAASTSLRPGSGQALTWLLTAMLFASGLVAFVSAWAAADPTRVHAKRLELQRLDLLEIREEILAAQEEHQHAEDFLAQVVSGDDERYNAALMQTRHHAEYLKNLTRTQIAESLGDPAATSALSHMTERSTDDHEYPHTPNRLSKQESTTDNPPDGQRGAA